MEEKIVVWTVATMVALFAALTIYGFTSQAVDGDTIRYVAEKGIVIIAVGMAVTSLRKN